MFWPKPLFQASESPIQMLVGAIRKNVLKKAHKFPPILIKSDVKIYLKVSSRESVSHVVLEAFYIWGISSHSDSHSVATSKLILQMLPTAQAHELTVDHNSHSGAQGITFSHAEKKREQFVNRVNLKKMAPKCDEKAKK